MAKFFALTVIALLVANVYILSLIEINDYLKVALMAIPPLIAVFAMWFGIHISLPASKK